MTEQLKPLPCPFCGSAPKTSERPDNIDGTRFFYAVVCYCGRYSACAHKMAVEPTPEQARQVAIEAWNRRAQPAQAVPVLSDEEIVYQTDEIPLGDGCFIKVARAVEQAVRAKMGAAVPMTHMQIVTLWGHRSDGPSTPEIVSFARLVERHHGIVGKEDGNV